GQCTVRSCRRCRRRRSSASAFSCSWVLRAAPSRSRRSASSRASGCRSGEPHGSGSSSFRWWSRHLLHSVLPAAGSASMPRSRVAIQTFLSGKPTVRVSVVIPTYNEAASLGLVLADIPAADVAEVVVVDSDSTDGTPEIAARAGARVVREPRRGYGRACLTGLGHVASPDVVVFLDGDYSDRPAEMPGLRAPRRAGTADLVVGSRLAGARRPGAMPWHAVAGNRLAAAMIRALCDVALTDLGPFRAARHDLLRSLE